MKTVNVAAAAWFAVILSLLAGSPAKAQVLERGQTRNPPAEAVQAAPPLRTPFRPERADLYQRTPRFMVQMLRFEAIDETGPTHGESDEVLVKYDTPNYWMRTRVFGDVDAGETRDIAPSQSCIYPARDPDDQTNGIWECNNQGGPGPLSFTITLREHNSHLANIRICPDTGAHRNDLVSPAECTLSNTDAQLIGQVNHHAPVSHLVGMLPTEWSSRDFSAVVSGANAQYRLRYRITRTGDLVTGPVARPD